MSNPGKRAKRYPIVLKHLPKKRAALDHQAIQEFGINGNTTPKKLAPTIDNQGIPQATSRAVRCHFLKCPGCDYNTQWRHRFVAHLCTCRAARLKVQPSTTSEFISQLFKISARQASELIPILPDANKQLSLSGLKMPSTNSCPNRWLTLQGKPVMQQPLHKLLTVSDGSSTVSSHPIHRNNSLPQSQMKLYNGSYINNNKQHLVIAPALTQTNNDHPVDLSLNSAKAKRSSVKSDSPLRSSTVTTPNGLHPNITVGPTSHKPTPHIASLKQAVFMCGHCPYKASTADQIQTHLLKLHGQSQKLKVPLPTPVLVSPPNAKTFSCNHCSYQTCSELCMVRHLLSLHRSQLLPVNSVSVGQNKVFSCSYCNFSSSEFVMIDHMLSHYKNHLPCNACSSCINWSLPIVSSKNVTPRRNRPISTKNSNSKTKTPTSTSKSNLSQQSKYLPNTSSTAVKGHTKQNKDVPNLPSVQQTSGSLTCHICKSTCDSVDQLKLHISTCITITSSAAHTQTTLPSNENGPEVSPLHHTTCVTRLHNKPRTSITWDPLVVPTTHCNDKIPSTNNPKTTSVFKLQSITSVHDIVPSTTLGATSAIVIVSNNNTQILTSGKASDSNISANVGKISSDICRDSQFNISTETVVPQCQPRNPAMSPDNSILATIAAPHDSGKEMSDGLCPPAKRRKLSVKIFKNNCGEYELMREGTPEVPLEDPSTTVVQAPCQDSIQHSQSLDLSIRIPLSVLPYKKQLSEQCVNEPRRPEVLNTVVDLPQHVASSPQHNFHQMPMEINHALTNGNAVCNGNEVGVDVSEMHKDIIKEEAVSIDYKSGKAMANLLKEKLFNIHLKNNPTSEVLIGSEEAGADVVILDSDDEEAGQAANTSGSAPITGTGSTDAHYRVMGFESDEVIDLTLDDSDDSDDDDHLSVRVGTSCTVKVDRLPSVLDSNLESHDIKEDGQQHTAVTGVETETKQLNLKDNSKQLSVKITIDPVMPPTDSAVNDVIGDDEVSNAGTDERPIVNGNLQKLTAVRGNKQVRRRSGMCALPTIRHDTNTIDEDDMIVCPFCPKRLLYRLLPAHIQFHGSNCEHKCKECNFASSFKWVLDTHISCHKDSSSLMNARQITIDEWNSIKDDNLSDDEEVEMAQKLLIKEYTASTSQQIARKTGTKKVTYADGVTTATTKKSSVGSMPVGTAAEQSVRVDKTKVLCTEDFFAKMLTEIKWLKK